MKIAIEAQRIFRTNKHGMDFVALETIRELQKLDHIHEYYILVAPGEDHCLEESANFHIIEIKCPTYPLWEQVALPLAIRKIKPDIVHCTSNTAPLFCPAPLILTLHDIIFLESRQHYLKICCENENYELRGRISDYETMLEKYGFVRVNIGFIINCKYIKILKTKKIILCNGMEINIGSNRHDKVRHAYMEYVREKNKWKL